MNRKLIRQNVADMQAYTPGEQPTQPGIIKLNTNENPYPVSPSVKELFLSFDPDRLRLYPNPTATALRARIAQLHDCRPEEVFVGNGSDEVLAVATRAFVEDNQAIGYFDPSYSLYPVLADIRAVAKAPIPLDADSPWRIPSDHQSALFFFANPNAPLGIQADPSFVADFARAYPGTVIIDEAYADFARTNCLQLACTLDNVLCTRTLSKSYSLAGLRMGYAVGPAPLIAALMKVKDSYNVDMLSQEIAIRALSDRPHLLANTARIIATRQRLREWLINARFVVPDSQTNFLFAIPPAGVDAAVLFRQLRENNILVRYFPGPRTGHGLRITIGTDPEIDTLISALHRLIPA